jgi:hypothetical protein
MNVRRQAKLPPGHQLIKLVINTSTTVMKDVFDDDPDEIS